LNPEPGDPERLLFTLLASLTALFFLPKKKPLPLLGKKPPLPKLNKLSKAPDLILPPGVRDIPPMN
jgi:hypothetical protein